MDFREASYMVSIYRNKNITKAARELYISQPSLSRCLQNVENRLGFPLFTRSSNEYIPTYNGQRYLDYAIRMLQLGHEWDAEYLELRNEKRGILTIAIPLMRCSCMIPETYPKFHAEFPNVSLQLREETHMISPQLLLTDDIDFAVYNPVQFSSSLEYISLKLEPFVLVCQKGHPLKRRSTPSSNTPYPFLSLSDCKEESFILHVPEQNSGRMALELFAQHQITPNILLHTHSTEVAISLAASGIGVAFAPETYVLKMQNFFNLSCFSIGVPTAQVELMAVYRKGKFLPSYAQYYIDLLKSI